MSETHPKAAADRLAHALARSAFLRWAGSDDFSVAAYNVVVPVGDGPEVVLELPEWFETAEHDPEVADINERTQGRRAVRDEAFAEYHSWYQRKGAEALRRFAGDLAKIIDAVPATDGEIEIPFEDRR